MTQPIESPISTEEDTASQRYETKTNRLIQAIVDQVRKAIAAILIAENRFEDDELKAKVVEIVSSLNPSISKQAVTSAAVEGLELGIAQAALTADMDVPKPKTKDAKPIADDAMSYAKVIQDQAKTALRLAKKLPYDKNYIDTVLGSVKQVENKATRLASTIANRAQAEGVILAAKENDIKVVWVNETKACLHCLAYAGRVTNPDKSFGNHSYAAKPLDTSSLELEHPDGVKAPPLHPHCRCRLRVWDGPDPRSPEDIPKNNNDVTFPEALQREARRAVLRGDSAYDSLPTRIKAADKLLDAGAFLPKTVEARAAKAVKNGLFPSR